MINVALRLGLKVAMPGFLHKEKQLSAKEANRTRSVSKTRWVIESGEFAIASFDKIPSWIIAKHLFLITLNFS